MGSDESAVKKHFDDEFINRLLAFHINGTTTTKQNGRLDAYYGRIIVKDVFIAGSGPVGATYARIIVGDDGPGPSVVMADIGSQDSPIIGAHQKNSIKYQKDIDQFGHVIKAALQPLSASRQDGYIPNLGGAGWRPPTSGDQYLVSLANNPDQVPELNLKASAVTRTVGGMGTHWSCTCPIPHEDERKHNPISPPELKCLLEEAGELLHVRDDQYDNSVRQILVRTTLCSYFNKRVKSMPLAVKRREDNPHYVTWSAPDTILGPNILSPNTKANFTLLAEHRVTKVVSLSGVKGKIAGILLRDLKEDVDKLVIAKAVVLCCGAILTPQLLFNSGINPRVLGHYLCEQSLAFCQIILKQELIDSIPTKGNFGKFEVVKGAITKHITKYTRDPVPIPFTDPEPQITLPYEPEHPWHVQIHREAFSYGEVGLRADPRVIIDLRWFGPQESKFENYVGFGPCTGCAPSVTDIYGMPQPTFYVRRSQNDLQNDQRMMEEMTKVASILGSYLPESYPRFMDPGLALHITGTTRIGKDPETSVADENSRVHGYENLWVGGNGCIPDSTACNPTRTSISIAIKGARTVLGYLKSLEKRGAKL